MTEKQSTAVAVRREDALAPTSLPEMLAMAQAIHKSGLVPDSIKTPEQALVVMLKGRELGLRPMQSFAHIYVVNGQAAIDTKLMCALYEARGGSYSVEESTAERCTIKFHLRDGREFTYTLTMAEAQAAHWHQSWSKEKNAYVDKPTWKQMPRIMLCYATRRTGIRVYDPSCLFGTLTVDELESVAPANGTGEQLNELLNAPAIEGEFSETEQSEPVQAMSGGKVLSQSQSTPHWITRPEVRKAFWTWARGEMALGDDDVHAALGVEHIAEYEGTMAEAKARIEEWAASKASGGLEEESPEQAAQQQIPF